MRLLYILLLTSSVAVTATWFQRHNLVIETENYRLFTPSQLPGGHRPLVVLLHGCLQSPADFAQGTGFEHLADSESFFLLLPSQKSSGEGSMQNPLGCWNWFSPENQNRGSGETERIIQLVEEVSRKHPIDLKNIFVAGISAGASQAAILLSCYPEIFRAGSLHAGLPFGSAENAFEASQVMRSGTSRPLQELAQRGFECGNRGLMTTPVMIWQGTADSVVHPVNADHMQEYFALLNDLRDDGIQNRTWTNRVLETEKREYEAGQYGWKFECFHKSSGKCQQSITQVYGMGHAWSGGRAQWPFHDPRGPSATRKTWDFFRTQLR